MLFSTFFLNFKVVAQDSLYIRQVVDYLSSNACFGRGYAFRGDSIAAEYIRLQMKQLNLLPLTDNYYQYFSFGYNVMEGEMEVNFGKNYPATEHSDILQICAFTPQIKGNFNIIDATKQGKNNKIYQKYITQKNNSKQKNAYKNRFIMVDMSVASEDTNRANFWRNTLLYNTLKAKGYIALQQKIAPYSPVYGRRKAGHALINIVKDSLLQSPKKISLNIDAQYVSNYTSQNVCAYIKGKRRADSCIVIGAHYDHCGMAGKNYIYPGANDNACGVAMLLSLAAHYSLPQNQPDYTLIFLAFSGEEMGLVGSSFFVNHLPPNFPAVKMMLNLDLVGTGEEGFTMVGAKAFPAIFAQFAAVNEIKHYATPLLEREMSPNSDHYPFYQAGIPAVFIYGMGKSGGYHHPTDTPQNLSFGGCTNLYHLLIETMENMMKMEN
ncbi:MAG: M28 family peptidase [Bacteroidales bacterium]|nr:M28 family peptidase [Bacteroidales bacterium]